MHNDDRLYAMEDMTARIEKHNERLIQTDRYDVMEALDRIIERQRSLYSQFVRSRYTFA